MGEEWVTAGCHLGERRNFRSEGRMGDWLRLAVRAVKSSLDPERVLAEFKERMQCRQDAYIEIFVLPKGPAQRDSS